MGCNPQSSPISCARPYIVMYLYYKHVQNYKHGRTERGVGATGRMRKNKKINISRLFVRGSILSPVSSLRTTRISLKKYLAVCHAPNKKVLSSDYRFSVGNYNL